MWLGASGWTLKDGQPWSLLRIARKAFMSVFFSQLARGGLCVFKGALPAYTAV